MKEHPITRREFLRLTGMAAGATMIAACGSTPAVPAASQTAAPAEPAAAAATAAPATGAQTTALNLLNENWGDIYNKLMINISDDFTKNNPEIAIKWNFDPDWQTKLTTLLAGGTPHKRVLYEAKADYAAIRSSGTGGSSWTMNQCRRSVS